MVLLARRYGRRRQAICGLLASSHDCACEHRRLQKNHREVMKASLAVWIILISFGDALNAATRTAASTSAADVLAAYNLSSSGDTVLVPSGSSTWTSALVIQKRINIQGAGASQTVLTSSSGLPLYRIYADGVRVTGFAFNGN